MSGDSWTLTRGFDLGRPLAATAADMAATSERLRAAVCDGFAEMQRPLEQALRTLGVPAARAPSLAWLMITNLEGALILARSQREVTPLDIVVTELGPGTRRRGQTTNEPSCADHI